MTRVALVTGANQGLGLALARGLARRLEKNDIVYLCARNEDRGLAAVASLGETRAAVKLGLLDVTKPESIANFAAKLQADHGGIDIVVSNAAARMVKDRPQEEQVRQLIATNNHGSRALLGALWPLLNPKARYVMVASGFGRLSLLPCTLRPLFDTNTLSFDDIEGTMDAYVAAAEAGTAKAEGWPEWINVPSKIGQVATARIAARKIAQERPEANIMFNAVCPGLVDTDASRPWFDNMDEAQNPDDAARAILDLVLASPEQDLPKGELVQFGKVLPWLD
ncbi:SDR family NAD(P)-dependent oxidoreductase [Pseudovibrio sp. SPO723]|uniref:SDR family NAD(P)-dependent oxidoreductase n=1 Tax=Nesiotobacter zosterae TaxID=392721 RepID=UPI0029C2E9AE|nr:SDR family NAD(P)-dependent oxidoreductase [Pseudovibrio sp. SPO723]MDX5593357.1 SDR family NAD(P)-dependent oxidoreductase [Pseudovibrio sp. SPO723]